MVPSLLLLSREYSVSVKENPDKTKICFNHVFGFFMNPEQSTTIKTVSMETQISLENCSFSSVETSSEPSPTFTVSYFSDELHHRYLIGFKTQLFCAL